MSEKEKTVEEQAADAIDRLDARDHRQVLEKGRKDRNVLELDEGTEQRGLRSNVDRPSAHAEARNGASPELAVSDREGRGLDGCAASVRQSEVREAGASFPGDGEGERDRHGEEGQSSQRQGTQPLSEGASVHSPERKAAVMQLMSQSEKGGASQVEKSRPTAIQAQADGQLVGSTFEDQFRLARAYHASGLMPQALNSPEKVLVAMQLCRELSLPPMTSVGKVCIVNGTPSIFGDLPLALVIRSGQLEEIREWYFDEAGNELDPSKPFPDYYGGACELKRVGRPTVRRVFTRRDAEKAGLWGKRVWAVYPKRMIQMRPRSWCIKDVFPDVLNGVSILEYDNHAIANASGEIEGADVASKVVAERFK